MELEIDKVRSWMTCEQLNCVVIVLSFELHESKIVKTLNSE